MSKKVECAKCHIPYPPEDLVGGICAFCEDPRPTFEDREKSFNDTGMYLNDKEIVTHINSDTNNVTPTYYGAKCKCGRKMDPYTVCDAYPNISSSAHHHAVKKLLRAGEGHKELSQDIQEVIDSLTRWQEQLNDN